jgi:hypothetical protein
MRRSCRVILALNSRLFRSTLRLLWVYGVATSLVGCRWIVQARGMRGASCKHAGAGLHIAGVVKPQHRLGMISAAYGCERRSQLSFGISIHGGGSNSGRFVLFQREQFFVCQSARNRSGLILEPVVQSPVRATPHSDPPRGGSSHMVVCYT